MGIMDQLVLSDGQWDRLSAYINGTERTRGSSGRDNRLFVEAVLRVVGLGFNLRRWDRANLDS